MQINFKQQQNRMFNDYTISSQRPNSKLLSSHDRSPSSASIYYQNTFSRKKLTVTSRDNSKSDFKGDYQMIQNFNHYNSSNQTKIQNLQHHLSNHVPSSYGNSINSSQTPSSLTNSGIQRNKLKRSTSPSPLTPTKVMKLKKSFIKETNQYSNNLIRSQSKNLSHRRYQSQNTSPMRIEVKNNHNFLYKNQIQPNIEDSNIQKLKRQVNEYLQKKAYQFQQKINMQNESINFLQNKLEQNKIQLRNKQKQIQSLKSSINIKTMNIKQNSLQREFIFKKVRDIYRKYLILIQIQKQCKQSQQKMDKKIELLNVMILKLNNSKFKKIQNILNQFITQKTSLFSSLNQQISYLDNKLIGRTQVLKQTFAELKSKVKQLQYQSTHKSTKDTTNRDKSYDDVTQAFNFSNKNLKHFQNKLKQLTSFTNQTQNLFQKPKIQQDSLDYSLTSYDQNVNLIKKNNHKNVYQDDNNHKNVYYDDNLTQMEDLSITGFVNNKNQMSNLTDDFYYPQYSQNSSKNISPIINKKQKNQYFQSQLYKNKNKNFKKKQSPKIQSSKLNQNQFKQDSLQQIPHIHKQLVVKISNQAINKKIQSIKQLIQNKKISSCEQIQKGQIRCFLDKSGYLKYTDSKTFVFDKKGNLISCSQGQFWFLCTKGLIYGKRQNQQSKTMSFIQLDQ